MLFQAASLLVVAATGSTAQIILGHLTPLISTRLDPIVDPGVVGGHVHTILGGSNFGSKFDTAFSQDSSCTTSPVTLDKSNYWQPSLYWKWKDNSGFSLVPHTGGNTYYINRASGDKVEPFPTDFRMLGGDPNRRNFSGSVADKAVSYVCRNVDGSDAAPQQNSFFDLSVNCPGGWRMQVNMPQCGDGRSSSTDNSHVSYATAPDNGPCPSSHPHHYPSVFYEFFVMNAAGTSAKELGMTADTGEFVLANGDATGYGLHADFSNGWDATLLSDTVSQCFGAGNEANNYLDKCPPLVAAMAAQPKMTTPCTSTGQQVSEDIGDQNKIAVLPGCNAVWDGTGAKPTCAALSVPQIVGATAQIADSLPQALTNGSVSAMSMQMPSSASNAMLGLPSTMATMVTKAKFGAMKAAAVTAAPQSADDDDVDCVTQMVTVTKTVTAM